MSTKRALEEGLRRIDPVREKRLDQLKESAPPDLLLEQLLGSDFDLSRTPFDGGSVTPPWRRRGPRIALGAAFALGCLIAALTLSAGNNAGSKAFAVEPHDGGGVTIKLYSLEEAAELEGALADAGIRAQVTWLAAGKVCREPHYTPSRAKTAMGGSLGVTTGSGPAGAWTVGIMSAEQYRGYRQKYTHDEISADKFHAATGNITLDPAKFRPDQSVVLSGTPVPYNGDPEGGSIITMGVAKGPVEPCKPVPALPSGSGPISLSPGGGPPYIPIGDSTLGRAAIAADLSEAARAAETSDDQIESPPGPGQFLYAKTRELHLEGWLPKGSETRPAGTKEHPRYFTDRSLGEPDVRDALVQTLKEVWTAADGKTRERETLGRVEFFSDADQSLWEAAGSPPPFAYDPGEHDVRTDGSGRPVKEFASQSWRGRHAFSYVANNAKLPTEPDALRLAIENRRGASAPAAPSPANSARGGGTVERLLEILREPIATPALRAAAFSALAEIPQIGFERAVVDGVGRRGDAISWARERGFGRRVIFDPRTSRILSEAEMILGPPSTRENGVSAGTPFRETAYLQSGIVGSVRATIVHGNGEPVATASGGEEGR